MLARIRSNPIILGLIAVALVVALAFGWWTVSPLFIRTSLSEGQDIILPAASQPAPDVAMAATTMAVATPTNETNSTTQDAMMEETVEPTTEVMAETTTEDMEAPTPQAMQRPEVLATGSFDRKDDVHYASGQAIVARQEDGSLTLRLQELDAANGPDLYVYLSEHPDPLNSEQLHEGNNVNLGSLKATNGSFNYALDPTIDPAKIKSVVIYCRAFSVIFSTAMLQAP